MKQPCAAGQSESSGSELGSGSTHIFSRRLGEFGGNYNERAEGRAALSRNRTAMPSVGMRRPMRVFGVVKGADGARVLRSGRRLWPDSGEVKGSRRGSSDGDDWFRLLDNRGNGHGGGGGGAYKKNGWALELKSREGVALMGYDDHIAEVSETMNAEKGHVDKGVVVDKMFGLVYSRKRKRLTPSSTRLFYSESKEGSNGKRYGLQFARRLRRKKNSSESSVVVATGDGKLDTMGEAVLDCSGLGPVIVVVNESSLMSSVACFLNSVLRYMKRARMRLSHLYAFLSSEPISLVCSSNGIRFMQDHPSTSTSGICKIYPARQSIPMFTVDFSAVPQCFLYMHLSMFRPNKCLPFILVNNSLDVETIDDISDDEELQSCVPSERFISESALISSEADNLLNRAVLHPSVRASKLAGRTAQSRNSLNSRSFQKRRSSLRSRRARNPSLAGPQKPNGSLVSDLNNIRKSGTTFSSLLASAKFRRSVRGSSGGNLKEVNSTQVKLPQDIDFSCCSANILVTESEKGYREEGAIVMLERSSGEWCLVVKKDEITRYRYRAQNIMRSWTCNRFTHAIIWTGDSDWKLEFPNRQDWAIFKDLYKECSDHNVLLSPSLKSIPVPGVHEVSDYGASYNATFLRPDSYITLNNDEVTRALAKRTANYDMDSEDEEWLNKFNNEFFGENVTDEHVSEDSFESMVDTFEKAYYCSPDDYSDENAAMNHFLDLGRREIVEAVYNYWMKKRKLKRSALLRVFQGHQQKRASLIPKPVLRKRRSFKRQPSQFGRGKQPSVLQAIAAGQDALEIQNALQRVEEARASVKRCTEVALGKRKRAQSLMESADLAAYKATLAVRIAESAQVAEPTDCVAHFLD